MLSLKLKRCLHILLLVLAFAPAARAEIDRFFPIEPGRVYRGSAANSDDDYDTLKRLHVRTVLDLRQVDTGAKEDPKRDDERRAKLAGLNYVNVPIEFTVVARPNPDLDSEINALRSVNLVSAIATLDQLVPSASQVAIPGHPDLTALISEMITKLGSQGLSSSDDAKRLLWALSYYLAPTQESVEAALSILRNPRNWPIYVHCQIGRDRTGLLVAMLRTSNSDLLPKRLSHKPKQMPVADAYAEMLSFGFSVTGNEDPTGFIYGGMKDYLFTNAGK